MRTIVTGGVEVPQAVAVVGLGLIGTSLCRALREHLPDMGLVGVTRRMEIAERAMDDGVCDLAGTTPDLLRHADIAVLCTPVDTMPQWLEAAAGYPDLVVTDCGSTKRWVVEQAGQRFDAARFLGGHPMAGRESSGYDAADPTLFESCTWVLTPSIRTDMRAFEPWMAAIRALGAHLEIMEAGEHDVAVAWISHLPFALSAALVRAAAAAPEWPQARMLAAGGFRDMARLAGGDAAMYAAIVESNGAAIQSALNAFAKELERLGRAVRRPHEAEVYFEGARRTRAAWLEERREKGRPVQ